MAPEDDFVTLLWDADYAHVVYQAIDSFAEGDQAARGRFERDVGEVVALAHFDTSFQLEECWGDHKGKGRTAANRDAELLRLLSLPNTTDPEANARAHALRLREIDFGPGAGESPVHVEMSTLRELSRTLVSSLPLSDKFLLAVVTAYRVAHQAGIAHSVTTPIRATVDQLAAAAPERAIELISSLCAAFEDERDPLRAPLVGAVVSERTVRAIFEGALGEARGSTADTFEKGLATILTVVDDTHLEPALEVLPSVRDGAFKELLIGYVARVGDGHEAELAALFEDAELDLGLALIRVLVRIGTPKARDAIASATKSRHAVVRIEALGHMEGVSSERLRLELRALLEDPSSDVRIAALRAMHDHTIRVAGPFLVLRIKAPGFDRLEYDERRQALHTLATLAPLRAETVCLELLAEARMVTSEAHEETRALAAEVLGVVASTPEAMTALDNASTARWKNSERVRISATHAKERAVIRLSQHPGAPLAAKERTS
jgi:hypothetical protein